MSRKHQKNRRSKFVISLVDIIIPAFDMSAMLINCLKSIPDAAGDIIYNIIIVDNGSKAEEIKAYREFGKAQFGDKLHIIEMHRNTGFPHACNRGASFGYSPLLFFLNDDVILYPNSIDKLVRYMDEPKTGAVGMKLIFPKDSNDPRRPAGKVQHVGMSTNIKGDFIHNFVGWSPDNPRVLAVKESYAITGAAMMTRKILFKQVHGFDEQFGMGCLAGDTFVFTEDGIKELKELIPDDENILSEISENVASDFKARLSTLAYKNGESDTLKIKLEKDFDICGTPNHKIKVMSDNGNIVWKQLDELKIGDYVGIRYGMNMFGNNQLDTNDAYLFGLYVAEGSYEKCGRITITNADKEIQEFLIDGYGFSSGGRNGIQYRKQSVELSKWFSNYIDLSKKALTKIIPNYILQANKETQIAFLQGLFDGDGCAIKDGRINYSTSSHKLAKQLQMMLLNFGIVTGIYSRISNNGNLNYLMDFGSDSSLFYDKIGFGLKRKQERKSNVRPRFSPSIPYQRNYFKSLYSDLPFEEREYKTFGAIANNSFDGGLRRDTIQLLVDHAFMRGVNYRDENMNHLGEILRYECVWLKVKSIEDGGIQETFDIHIPDNHTYIANGLIVHNTYEDVNFCLMLRDLGYNIRVAQDAIGEHFVGATALDKQIQYPLHQNRELLLAKRGGKLLYTEWEIW